jgi:hypothetical protein
MSFSSCALTPNALSPRPRFWKLCLTAGAAQLNFIHTCTCQAKDKIMLLIQKMKQDAYPASNN